MKGSIAIEELSPDLRRKLGLTKRNHTFTKESVRSYALKVLEEISDLTQDQRRRVLEHAIQVNKA